MMKGDIRMRRILCLFFCVIIIMSLSACFLLNPIDTTPAPSPDAVPTATAAVTVSSKPNETPSNSPFLTEVPTDEPVTPTPEPTEEPTPTPKPTPKPTPYCNPLPTSESELELVESGKRFMKKLKQTPGYENLDLRAKYGFPYLICINKEKNCVTVFCVDENGEYTRPYSSMICTGGEATPLGIYKTPARYSWHTLMGPSYGQYCTRIIAGVLFHSVPYYTPHKYDLQYKSFNRLGLLVSHGCVRLAVNDSKWIYDNCPIGTTVVIYNDSSSDGPLRRPKGIKIDTGNIFLRGWDPTDPDKANPWGDRYIAGTTNRSELAQADYDYAVKHRLWESSINPPERPTPTPNVTPTPELTDTPEVTETPCVTETPDPTPGQTPEDTPEPTPAETQTPAPTDPPESGEPGPTGRHGSLCQRSIVKK